MHLLADDDAGFRYTDAEAAMIAKLAQVRIAADGGNRKAKAQIAKVGRQLAALKKLARKGSARAARAAQVLEESGLLNPSQTFAMEGVEPLTPATSDASWNPWNWRVGALHVTPIALMAISGVLAWTGRWKLATVPMIAWGLHEGHQQKWW
jgi:hypothetical protein